MSDPTTLSNKWHLPFIERVHALCEECGLDDFHTSKWRDFVITVAKEQYKVGNRSGIRWAREQMRAPTSS
jgi:RNA polymerase subunit RPABC4/transcription elongation factor Spt4